MDTTLYDLVFDDLTLEEKNSLSYKAYKQGKGIDQFLAEVVHRVDELDEKLR